MNTSLKRNLSLPIVTLYGIGTIIGAGIYVLIGKIALIAGIFLPFALLLSAVIAGFTALSYAELSSHFPQSSGAAVYLQKIWCCSPLSAIVGYLVALTSIVSAATILHGFSGYLNVFFQINTNLVVVLGLLALGIIAIIGIDLSAKIIALITLIELSGLFIVIAAGLQIAPIVQPAQLLQIPTIPQLSSIVMGAFVAFYAFIGFEDMVNIIEETKNPRSTLAKAIILAITICTLFYLIIAYVVVTRVPIDQIGSTAAPFTYIVKSASLSENMITIISLIAVVNGALVQIIVSARILYGMSNLQLAPKFLGIVNNTTRTPIYATLIILATILIFALCFPLLTLAQITSFLILLVFSLVNFALVSFKLSDNYKSPNKIPVLVPIVGGVLPLILLVYKIISDLIS